MYRDKLKVQPFYQPENQQEDLQQFYDRTTLPFPEDAVVAPLENRDQANVDKVTDPNNFYQKLWNFDFRAACGSHENVFSKMVYKGTIVHGSICMYETLWLT